MVLKDRVEKLHVLAVLEKQKRAENASGILALLKRDLGFKFDKRDRARAHAKSPQVDNARMCA